MTTLLQYLSLSAMLFAVPAIAAAPLTLDRESRWTGTGVEGAEELPIELTTNADGIRVDYPSRGCGGALVAPEGLADDRAPLAFTEKLDYGHDKCADNGVVLLRNTPNGLEYNWSPGPDALVERRGILQVTAAPAE